MSSTPPTPQQRLLAGRYELGELLGSGGFASVYVGHDARAASGSPRALAIKIIDHAHATPELTERFRNEALALSRLSSPNIARVFDFGSDEIHGLYFVMELIRGVSLDVASLGRALGEREVFEVARALFAALADAHAHGIVHRDIKPENVLVPGGIDGLSDLKVLDFGIAMAGRRSEVLAAVGSAETLDGHIVGTPAYMAPEQITLGEVGPAADVYSAGLVLFELLGHGPLFTGPLPKQIAGRIAEDPVLVGRAPPLLANVLARALARNPADRFRDATEALLALPTDAGDPFRATAPNAAAVVGGTARAIPSAPGSRRSLPSQDRARSASKRLSRLDRDPARAYREALFALDLSFVDALARREGDREWGIIARATSLAFRIELDAAARVLEPLLAQSPAARAVAATLIAPRADAKIVARLDGAAWIDDVDPALGCLLATATIALGGSEHAASGLTLCESVAARAGDIHEREVALYVARLAGGILGHESIDRTIAYANSAHESMEPESAFEDLMRALVHGILAFRGDEHLARMRLEHAIEIAANAGAALFEARALLSWGAVMLSVRPAQGLVWLERATALLAESDATSLEQMAEHNVGAAMMIQRRYADAVPHLQRSIELARRDGREEYSMLATANLAFARLTRDDEAPLAGTMADLDHMLETVSSPRARAFVFVAKTLHALRSGDDARASSHVREARTLADQAGIAGTDAWLMAEVLAVVVGVAHGESIDVLARAGELEHLARERGFVSFFWFDVMLEALVRVPNLGRRDQLLAPMKQFMMLLGPTVAR